MMTTMLKLLERLISGVIVIVSASIVVSLSAWSITKLVESPTVTIKVVGRALPGELNKIIWLEDGLGYIVLDSLEACTLGVRDSMNVYITFHVEEHK